MNMWEAIVVIVLIASVARVIRAHYRQQGGLPQGRRQQTLAALQSGEEAQREAARLRTELAEVNERIKVLERIVTDGHQAQSIAAEIEALRDR